MHQSTYPQFIKEEIAIAVYQNYLYGLTVEEISYKINLLFLICITWEDVNVIIDWYNSIFV